jgi:hypothetical protein
MMMSLFSRKRCLDSSNNSSRSSSGDTIIDKQDSKKSRSSSLQCKQSKSQHQATLSLASLHVASTQSNLRSSRRRLARATADYAKCQLELREALEWNDVVQSKWGIVHLDGDDDDNDGSVPIVNAVSEESDETESDDEIDDTINVASNVVAADITAQSEQCLQRRQIQIVNSGEEIVNGIYQHCSLSSSSNRCQTNGIDSHSDCIYINTAGPHLINGICQDVCLFQRDGYGDKFRWCLGLVPCSSFYYNAKTAMNDANDHEVKREWRFDRAYIYYWMDAPRFNSFDLSKGTSGGEVDDHESLFRNEWSACHGARPVPLVKDVVERSDGWWWWSKLLSIW